ncbi:MAG TPA: PAS domain S-box protein [Methanotrichaceae archaeon]|nr:PAS domain S-box protein [Methanotrichaceae archaeon]
MKKENAELNQNSDLRRQAEELLKNEKSSPVSSKAEESIDALSLVHELQVHQIELEMQNEELKRATLEAEDALTKYSDLYDFAPIGLFTLDEIGAIKEVNQAGATLLGQVRRNLLDMRFALFVAEGDRRSFNGFLKKALETHMQACELSLVRDEGTPVYVAIEGAAAKDSSLNGKQCRIAVIDITERKLAEDALRETRDYLENLINCANAPIIIWDTSIRITRFNHAFERLTGLRTAEALGEPLKIIFPESRREESMEHIGRTLSGGRWEVVEIPVLHADGSVRTVLWNSANIYDKDRTTIVATIAQGQDITERKQMEMELRKAHDELELKVQERTAELLKAKDAAEAAAEAKAAFLANMSHELRTPMNYILGMTSLLLEEPLTPELKEYVETIRGGGDDMMALINDLLDFSSAEKEKIVLEHQPLSLRALIEESLELIASQAVQKSLNLGYTINYGTPEAIVGDHGRLRQVLVSMLSNAVKFTDVGDISVSISSKHIEGKKYQILFMVKDTGMGILPEKMNELFLPFSQVEMTISRKRNGAGIGLAISKRLVKLMGGEIWATSTPGEGSTFYFTIEAEIAPGKLTKPESSYKPNENLAEQHPLRILVAEDNPSNQKVLREMLKRMGYRPDAVADGREVLQALEIRHYDLVLMDVKMPEMNGLAAARQIRKLWPAEDQPRIVAITAYALEGDREKCLEAGMDDYIAKPVMKEDLATLLCNITLPRMKIEK